MRHDEAPVTNELELTYPAAAELAFRLHTAGRFEASELIYRRLLDVHPDDQNVIHFLGVLMHQTGRRVEARAMIERSLAIDDQVAAWHNNYGNVLLDEGRFSDAESAYRRCVGLDPANVDVLCNLGLLSRRLTRFDEAEAFLKRALAVQPDFVNAHLNLSALHWDMGRYDEAFAATAAALRLFPQNADIRRMQGHVFVAMGRLEEAAEVYRALLADEPENHAARHHLAGCTGVDVPERAQDAYVESLFDRFASTFDAKLAAIQYRAPQLVADAVARLLPEPRKNLRVLDAGCGTGLCGSYLAPYAGVLEGVDLSANMLELARARGQYTTLVKGELVAHLAAVLEPFDLVVSADTLCYFGRLDHAAREARHALRDGGLLIFTVEVLAEDADYRLQPNGRYGHRTSYVRATLVEAGFDVRELTEVVLRLESGRPVNGVLAIAEASTPAR